MTSGTVQELWRYRELFYFLLWRDIKIRYRQTALGAAWAIIQPLFGMVLFTLLFGKLAKMPSDGIPYPVFFYSTLVPWTYFSGAISFSGNSLISNSDLIRKVYFPRVTLPVSAALGGLLDFAIAFVVLVVMMFCYGLGLSWGLLLWPVLIFQLLLLASGVGMFLSAMNVRYRDVKYAIPFLMQLWLFASPIIWPLSIVPAQWRWVAQLNPLAGIMEGFRSSLLGKELNLQALLVSMGATLILLLLGGVYFRKTERTFSDMI
jgi:lipopolysaccharide transport system permease protein